MRISDVHLHACFGTEAPGTHPSVHLADGGLFFGEHHAEDDGDDLEFDLPDQGSAKFDYPPILDVVARNYMMGIAEPALSALEIPRSRDLPPPRATYFRLTPPAQAPPTLS